MKKKSDNGFDWKDIIAIAVAVFVAEIIKGYIFTENLIEYSWWINLLVYMALFVPTYLLLFYILKNFKKK